MKFFIDTANIEEIKKANDLGLLDGVTTNPTLVSREGREFKELIKEICSIVEGPVNAEVVSTDAEGMLQEARELVTIADNIVVKIPLIKEGLRAVKTLSGEGIRTNVTLCFSPIQALMAAKAGASYISPFVGRLDDISHRGMDLVEPSRSTIIMDSIRRLLLPVSGIPFMSSMPPSWALIFPQFPTKLWSS
jgi:transaldolase